MNHPAASAPLRDALTTAKSAPQAYFAGVDRAIQALANLGSAVSDADARMLASFAEHGAVDEAEQILTRYVLLNCAVDAHGYAVNVLGAAPAQLVEKGWRSFLVRVENPNGLVERPHLICNPVPGFRQAPVPGEFSLGMSMNQIPFNTDRLDKSGMIESAWLQAALDDETPLTGFPLEYRVLNIYAAAGEDRVGHVGLTLVDDSPIGLHTGRQQATIPFEVSPSFDVFFDIRDADGETCVASLTISDEFGRIYPPQAMRVAPDMRFQPQIYRGDGESVRLPAGEYRIVARRGPEYLPVSSDLRVSGPGARAEIRLERWIDAESRGWYSGDPHIHAAGCSHYESPTEGVRPETMIRQVRGEALAMGGVLTWGPGYYYQKQFFTGSAISPEATLEHPELQEANNQGFTTAPTDKDARSTLRYDVEVSGFPSSHLGHVMLLDLVDQDYPGASMINDWPSFTLPVMKWAKEQGAVVGYAHCGFGMAVPSGDLPSLEMPLFNSIGTNEAIVDVTHGLADFLAGAEAEPAMEMSAWYHMLNCGFRIAMVGETDYPCIFDERPGVGRTYVQLDKAPQGQEGWAQWVRGLADGRLYFGDGRTHVFDFAVNGVRSGSTLNLPGPARRVTIHAELAAYLEPEPTAETEQIRNSPAFARPSWHIERARLGDSRSIPVEIVVNGQAVETKTIVADGISQTITAEIDIADSSWVALRVLPSVHTHPVFIEVDDKPIRASAQSAQWCRTAVDVLWDEKVGFIRPEEQDAARAAFQHARETYDAIFADAQRRDR